MPYRWTSRQRERSHRIREWLFLAGLMALAICGVLMIVDTSEATVIAVIGVALFGSASIATAGILIVGARRGHGDSSLDSASAAEFEPRSQPQVLEIQRGQTPGVPIVSRLLADEKPGRQLAGRSVDWINAGAWLAIGTAIPLLVHVVNRIPTRPLLGDTLMFLVGVIGFGVGGWLAWEAWRGGLESRSLQIDPDHKILSGRTGWPLKRWRSLRLDQLSRVRCVRILTRTSIDTYFVVRDVYGTTAMLEDEPRLRSVLLDALASQPGTRVSRLASRQLADMFTWWSLPLAALTQMAYLAAVVGAAVAMAAAFGITL